MNNGSSYWPSPASNHINTFSIGDIVVSTIVSEGEFMGIVREVEPKINKVTVAWGGGSLHQHDPDEIQLSPHQDDILRQRMASRRAMYWCGPKRTYRLTRSEINFGKTNCPGCKCAMDKENFTRSAKLYVCSNCGFKISSDKITDRPQVIEVHSIDPVVANLKSRRN